MNIIYMDKIHFDPSVSTNATNRFLNKFTVCPMFPHRKVLLALRSIVLQTAFSSSLR